MLGRSMISGEAFDPQFKPINAQMAMLSPKSLRSLGDFKLLFPTDWNDYVASHPVFVKEWNAMMGL